MVEAMIQDLEQMEYRKGMLVKDMKPDRLPVKVARCQDSCGNPEGDQQGEYAQPRRRFQ